MFSEKDILYEDNHILIVNKHCGDLVQPDPDNTSALEDQIKEYIRVRDSKPGNVFLGVVHRIDRPVSGTVVFAKTSKALARLNEMIREGKIDKRYWAIVEHCPKSTAGELKGFIRRDSTKNRSFVTSGPKADAKEARLKYEVICSSDRYTLLEVQLLTGRHHQIRAQLSSEGCAIKGDLKYGAKRSNPNGGISLHARRIAFIHPVSHTPVDIVAPVPQDDNLWKYFEQTVK